jgi:hypothetical protein|nr:MAG TPA: Firmicute plasmid replication protein (RepL) [Caudoviricetes sp.]
MNSSNVVNHKLVTYVDPETGLHVKQDTWQTKERKVNNKFPGYNLVYVDRLKEVLLYFPSVKACFAVLDLLSNEVSKDFTFKVDYKFIAQLYQYSEVNASRIIKLMKEADIIRGSRGVYKVNPFLIIPKGVSDSLVTREQDEWTGYKKDMIVSVNEASELDEDYVEDDD